MEFGAEMLIQKPGQRTMHCELIEFVKLEKASLKANKCKKSIGECSNLATCTNGSNEKKPTCKGHCRWQYECNKRTRLPPASRTRPQSFRKCNKGYFCPCPYVKNVLNFEVVFPEVIMNNLQHQNGIFSSRNPFSNPSLFNRLGQRSNSVEPNNRLFEQLLQVEHQPQQAIFITIVINQLLNFKHLFRGSQINPE